MRWSLRNEAVLPKSEQLPKNIPRGREASAFTCGCDHGRDGAALLISLTHPPCQRRFEMQVPEIYDGTVEI